MEFTPSSSATRRPRARRSKPLAYRKTHSLKSKRSRCARKDNPVNVHSIHRPPPRMTEAFEHPAGSVAARKAGGATQWRGKLLHIHVAPSASYEMEELQQAECVAGRGIVGDRYYDGTGTYSPKPDVREGTLIEQEALDAISRNDPPLQGGSIKLEPGDHRRNLTVMGVPLNHLVGRRFRVGDVILRGGRLNFPCKYLAQRLGFPVFLPL